jgi:hypothetical protein
MEIEAELRSVSGDRDALVDSAPIPSKNRRGFVVRKKKSNLSMLLPIIFYSRGIPWKSQITI